MTPVSDAHALQAIEDTTKALDKSGDDRHHLLPEDEDVLAVVFLVIKTMVTQGWTIQRSPNRQNVINQQ